MVFHNSGKGDSRGLTLPALLKFRKITNRNFLIHFISISEFPEFSGEKFAFRKLNKSWVLQEFPSEIFVSFAAVSEILNFWLSQEP